MYWGGCVCCAMDMFWEGSGVAALWLAMLLGFGIPSAVVVACKLVGVVAVLVWDCLMSIEGGY